MHLNVLSSESTRVSQPVKVIFFFYLLILFHIIKIKVKSCYNDSGVLYCYIRLHCCGEEM